MENKYLWIDAADFQNKGEWVLDTQFVHLMGSPYLLAVKAPGIPVEDAVTKVQWTGGKMVRAWVRTKNWYYPYAPGIFNLALYGEMCPVDLGSAPTHDWYWHLAGDFTLENGEVEVRLCDKSGYFGRCAAVLLTDDMDFVPKRPVDDYKMQRAFFTGKDLTPKMFGDYDVVVCGAGPGGVPAAVAAARHGAKTLLISGRPVIGGMPPRKQASASTVLPLPSITPGRAASARRSSAANSRPREAGPVFCRRCATRKRI